MNAKQLRELIEEVLLDVDLIKYEDKREVELLMLTAAVESQLGEYIKQIKGPALGIFQMEPATEYDIWENYLIFNHPLSDEVSRYVSYGKNRQEELKWNIAYAILMARIHYLRKSGPIPPANDVQGLAAYWKDHYNTRLGKGTVEKAIFAYNKYAL